MIYITVFIGSETLHRKIKQGDAVVSWLYVGSLGAFAYEERHAACRGLLWGKLRLGGNGFFLLFVLFFSSHLSYVFALIFHSPCYNRTA